MVTQGISFDPATDIPSLEGKAILITGANSGLGKQSSLELAKHNPAHIWMAARSSEKGNEAVAHVKSQVPGAAVTFLKLDLSSFDSIKSAAKTVLASSPRLDVLLLNAGRKRPTPERQTKSILQLLSILSLKRFANHQYSHGLPT